jgi:serine/threonine protein kinase
LIGQVKNEFLNLKCFDSDLIIRVYELFYNQTKGRLYLVMEYVENMINISQLCEKMKIIDEKLICRILKKILDALFIMHKAGICHR